MFKKISNEEYEELFGNVPIKDYEKICKYIQENFVSKDKIKEIVEKSFDEMLNHSNKFNCGDMQMLENNIMELLEEV